jgi:Cu2+-exporting ATPase
VFAATVVLTGKIYVRVEKAGDETTAAQIGEILTQTTEFKTAGQMRAESLAQKTVLPTLVAGGLSLPLLGPMGALAVINAHFSYRLSVVSSIAMFSHLQLISQKGILVKKGEMLDLIPQVDTIIFDKTGTLTLSKPHIGQIYPFDNYNEEQILTLAAAAENKQTHPIALAILEAANARALLIPQVQEIAYQVGYGLQVQIENQWIQVGSRRFMQQANMLLPPSFQTLEAQAEEQGNSLILVALNKQVIGALELLPTIRPEAQAVIDTLKQLPRVEKTYIISGDNKKPTQQLAHTLGIDSYFAQVLPQEKAALIEKLQNAGKIVCYIGDGINDSIALKKANVSISLSGASTIATDTAQIILMGEDLNQLCDLFQLAYEFDKTIQQGFHAVLTPTVIGIGGAFFLTFDVMDTIILKQLGLTIGLLNATYPLIKYRENRNEGVQSKVL